MMQDAFTHKHGTLLTDMESVLNESRNFVAACVCCKSLYKKLAVSKDKKSFLKNIRTAISASGGTCPAALMARLVAACKSESG